MSVAAADLERVLLLPVRHHSPRASAVVRALLETARPELVLIEGPEDATHLLPLLADPGTRPPIAILGYRTDGIPGSALWPFADYSPELVAARWAAGAGVKVAFIDIPIGVSLATHAAPDRPATSDDDLPDYGDDAATTLGFRQFEEMWEAMFEAPRHDFATFRAALLGYADLVRGGDTRPRDRARDAFMWRHVAVALADGVPAERIAVVAGAAHIAAFAAGDVDPACEKRLAAAVASASTLIPYSYPRLAAQLGYGAGNRAPRYYQRAHDAGCDFRRATLEVLVEFTEHMRLKGFTVSLSDTIEAFRLALMLASVRGKAEPGLDEIREAAIATICRGDSNHLVSYLWPSVIGRAVGQVPAGIGRNSLQEEFQREVRLRRLPLSDDPESFSLRLNNETEIGTSIFLHRLRTADVPYASIVATRGGGAATASDGESLTSLTRLRESWEAQWTPATDVALVERIVHGDDLQEVASRLLDERLGRATTTAGAAEVLLEAVLAACPRSLASALVACDRHAAHDDDLPSLARACRALAGLVAYGTSRSQGALGDAAVAALLDKTYARALLRVSAAADCDDPGGGVRQALRTLHEIGTSSATVDRSAWLQVLHELVVSARVSPSLSGMALGFLHLAREIDDSVLERVVGLRLGDRLEPLAAAAFLEGFLEASTLILVRSRAVVASLDGFLTSLTPERFRDVLPVLRRALAKLGPTERRYLLENLLHVRGLEAESASVKAVIEERDKDKLKGLNADLGGLMDDLDDLL